MEADNPPWAPGGPAHPRHVRHDVHEHSEHSLPGLRGDLAPGVGLPARSAATLVARAFAAYADGDWDACDRTEVFLTMYPVLGRHRSHHQRSGCLNLKCLHSPITTGNGRTRIVKASPSWLAEILANREPCRVHPREASRLRRAARISVSLAPSTHDAPRSWPEAYPACGPPALAPPAAVRPRRCAFRAV